MWSQWTVFGPVYTHMHAVTVDKNNETLNLKESREEFTKEFKGGKRKD